MYVRKSILKGDLVYDIKYLMSIKFYKKKILCLHGGGDSSDGLSTQFGMEDLKIRLQKLDDDIEFQFIDAKEANGDNIWLIDGKDENNPVNNSTKAIESINFIEEYIEENGPFYCILGFSQGVAIALSYISYPTVKKENKMFAKVALYNGYFPKYNTDLLSNMLSYEPVLHDTMIFTSKTDSFFSLSIELEDYFEEDNDNIITIESDSAGHALPLNTDATFNDTITFYEI